jgi:Ti-type conjugative transfer relaxase TraA
MAIYRLSSKSIGRSSGKSSVACAAYRAGEKLHDQNIEKTFDYTKKQGVYHSEILLPENAKTALKDRQTLWNEIEKSETRANASLAKEYQLALPGEISHEEKVKLATEFAKTQFTEKGLCVDLAFHDFEKENPHCHMMVTTRLINDQGIDLGKKPTFFRERSYLVDLRKSWEMEVNRSLERNGIAQRVSAESYKNQGINLEGISYKAYGGSAETQLKEQQKINGAKLLEQPHLIFDALNAREATFSKNSMISFVNRHSLPEQAENVLKNAFTHEQLVQLAEDRYTSINYLKSEKQLLTSAINLDQKPTHEINQGHAKEVSENLTLNSSQQAAFDYALASDSGIKNIIGMAGTGKSHTLKAITEVYQQSGYEVKGLALSGIVAQNLSKDANIEHSKTIHSFLSNYQDGYEVIGKKTVLVVDEASLVGTKQLSEIVKLTEDHQAKLIMVGDNQQLQAIDAGGAYRGVINATSHAGLDEIQRQSKAEDKQASLNLATGNVEAAFNHYRDSEAIHKDLSLKKSLSHVSENYFKHHDQDPNSSQMVLAYRKETVGQLNQELRQGFVERGAISNNPEDKTIANGKEFAVGDRFVFLKNEYNFDVRNGTTGTIERIQDKEFQIKADDGRIINFDSGEYKNFDHAYAMTIHKSQGITVDHAHLLLDKNTDRHLAYVGMTRHKESLNVYYHAGMDNKHAVRNFDQLVHYASRDNQKELASDYQQIIELQENNSPDKKTLIAEIGETLAQCKDWLVNRVEIAKEHFQAKNDLEIVKTEYQETSQHLDKVIEIREERESLQKEYAERMAHSRQEKIAEQEKAAKEHVQGHVQEKTLERGGFEMEL